MGVNIHRIAELCGVSIATVSRVLNNKGPVKESTKQKILQVAAELNYKPNSIARGLSRKQTDTIGVILPELVDEFFMNIIHGLDEVAHKHNKYLLVSSSHSQRDDMETIFEFMVGGRVDGVILMAPSLNDQVYDIIKKNRRPVVLLNCGLKRDHVVRFGIDNYNGARQVVRHLIGHGYKRIAMVQGPEGNVDAAARWQGYKDELESHNLEYDPKLVIEGKFTMRSGYYAFIRLMGLDKRPEAIFFANDMMALGAYHAAHNLKISFPQDVAIAGFDDIFSSSIVQPRLTTVHIPIVDLGRKSMNYLIRMINEEVSLEESYEEILSTGLVLGESCGCKQNWSTIVD